MAFLKKMWSINDLRELKEEHYVNVIYMKVSKGAKKTCLTCRQILATIWAIKKYTMTVLQLQSGLGYNPNKRIKVMLMILALISMIAGIFLTSGNIITNYFYFCVAQVGDRQFVKII